MRSRCSSPNTTSTNSLHRRQRLLAGLAAGLLLGTPSGAADYVHDERTAAEAIEHGGSPFDHALAKRRERIAKRRAWLKDAPPFLRDAHLDLAFRGYGFERLDLNGERRETWAAGSSLRFASGLIADRLSVGATLATAQKLHGPRDRDGLLMLRPRQTGLTVLSEAWADLAIDESTSLRAYRQELDLPFLNGHDSRMIPNTFEAYVLRRRSDDVGFVAGHVTRMKLRDSRQFVSMAEAAGVDSERGLSMIGARWSPSEELSVGFLDLVGWDMMNVLYSEVVFRRPLGDDASLELAAQFTHQTSIGEEQLANGSFSTYQAGVKAALTWRSARLGVMANDTGRGAALRSPWGGRPGYLSLMRADFDRANERAWGVDLAYDFAGIGAKGWSGFVRLARGSGARNSDDDEPLPTRFEMNVTLDYRPAGGFFKNFWLRLRWANLWQRGSERTGRDVRVILNYEIPLL